jgi:hypothetical protein
MYKLNSKKIFGLITSFIFIILLPLSISYAFGCNPAAINNPLGCNNTSVQAILGKIMNIVAAVGGVVVVFFIIYSGFKFVMAKGNPSEIEKAKETFFATVIGGAILLGAEIIANVVLGTINAIKN